MNTARHVGPPEQPADITTDSPSPPRSAREVALQLRALIGTPESDWLLAAVMLNSWFSLQRAVVALSERDAFVVDAVRLVAGGAS